MWLGDAMYVNDYGVATFSASDKFGDFDATALNYGVEEWLRERLSSTGSGDQLGERSFLEMIPVRAKNQLRLFFNDGWILIASFPPVGTESTNPHFTWQHYSYSLYNTVAGGIWPITSDEHVPSCISGAVSSWGEERIYIGTKQGAIQQIEHAYRNDNSDMDFTFAINPICGNNPLVDTIKVFGLAVGFERDFDCQMSVTHASNYEEPPYPSLAAHIGVNEIAQAKTRTGVHYTGEHLPDVGVYTHGELSNGVSWRVCFDSDWQKPLRFYALSPRMSTKGQLKARTQQSVAVASFGTSP